MQGRHGDGKSPLIIVGMTGQIHPAKPFNGFDRNGQGQVVVILKEVVLIFEDGQRYYPRKDTQLTNRVLEVSTHS